MTMEKNSKYQSFGVEIWIPAPNIYYGAHQVLSMDIQILLPISTTE